MTTHPSPLQRAFVVTAVQGHCDVTTFCDIGPRFIEVMVTAVNHMDEQIHFRRPVDQQPRVGDVVHFDETEVPA